MMRSVLRLSSRTFVVGSASRNSSTAPTSIRRFFASDSITYSGGHASEGQGGFYGSGGARAGLDDDVDLHANERHKVLAMAADVQKISGVMTELDRLESLLGAESSGITNKSIELKTAIKKLMTAPDVIAALNRLEVQGEPVWGLSTEERELVITAREKVNEC